MAHENFMSKTEDVVWFAYKLKDELGDKISINQFGLWKEVLEGRYIIKESNRYDIYDRGIDFAILYSDKEFLRVVVGENSTYAYSYEDRIFVLNELKNAISRIVRDGVSLGEPSVFYNVRDEEYMIPHLEYIYADRENYIKSFQDKTIFDDGGIPEDVIIFDITKNNEEFGIAKSYSYMTPDTQSKYCINIYAMLKNKSSIEENELVNILKDNLDELFNDKNIFSEYVTYNNSIAYIVAYVKNALSLAEEVELEIMVLKDGEEIHHINYINGHLVKYESKSKLLEYNFNTYYDIKDGIKFDTNCALNTSEITIKGVQEELQKINNLRNINDKYNVKSNQNLLKLVRRMGNK